MYRLIDKGTFGHRAEYENCDESDTENSSDDDGSLPFKRKTPRFSVNEKKCREREEKR